MGTVFKRTATKPLRVTKWFDRSLSEKDRRRYAAVEAERLGHGGVEYVSRLLGCDPKTIRQGCEDFDSPEDPVADRVRNEKGTVGGGETGMFLLTSTSGALTGRGVL